MYIIENNSIKSNYKNDIDKLYWFSLIQCFVYID